MAGPQPAKIYDIHVRRQPAIAADGEAICVTVRAGTLELNLFFEPRDCALACMRGLEVYQTMRGRPCADVIPLRPPAND